MNLPLSLLVGAAVALTLTPAPAHATADPDKPRLIAYAGGESPGVQVQERADAKNLRGAPKAFKRFIGKKAQRLTDHSTCTDGYVGVTVEFLRTDGYAVGDVNDCGGYVALWAVADGRWKEIAGTQDFWSCGVLKRHVVPSSIAGDRCYDIRAQRLRHYHQR
ncbi:hypothetical protein [Nocardioides sp. SR21]|uniref:hypothetical protein n=1 Tax=Nocardioides sp. SR21 TaxID=2919501 RepID=UPI001FAA4806|nr:hypothetical protein [Nocardioides sp. SR21]